MRVIRKYTASFVVSLQSAMEYRLNYLFSLASGAFAVVIQYFLWTAIYQASGEFTMFGYEYKQMVVYVILAGLLMKVVETGFEYEVAADIKEGGLSRFLVQPIKYLPYRIWTFFGQKLVQLVIVGIISAIILGVANVVLGFQMDPAHVGYLVLAIFLALCLNCLLYYCISLLSFWVTEVWAVFTGIGVLTSILSGGLFPLDVFGPGLLSVFKLLPFQYVIYFPLNIINSKYTQQEMLVGFCIQLIWIAALYLLSKWMWRLGLRKYIAAGG